MVDITAFKALKYNPEKISSLSRVVSLPYDVISPKMQDEYYSLSKKNIVRIILRKQAAARGEDKGDRYALSAKEFRNWIEEGTLAYENKPVVYLHRQSFAVNGRLCVRTGLLCLVKLEEFSKKKVLPHENTFPSHKADRLKLLEACEANLSPIFGLYEGKADFRRITSKKPYAAFSMKDRSGTVQNKVWRVSEPAVLAGLVKNFKNKKVFIADGHHRYEVGLFYRGRMRKMYPAKTGAPWNYIMFTLVSLHDRGLVVLPTHRIVRFVFRISKQKMLDSLLPYFSIKEIKAQKSRNIILYMDKKYYSLEMKGTKAISLIKEKHSGTWKKLPTAVLHHIILKKLPGVKEICYTRDITDIKEKVNNGSFHAGFIIPDISAKTVTELSYKREKMPHKTTYFYPKLPVGIAFNDLSIKQQG